MGSKNKTDRIEEIKIFCKLFYNTIDDMNKNKNQYSFTKSNFIEKFIIKDDTD